MELTLPAEPQRERSERVLAALSAFRPRLHQAGLTKLQLHLSSQLLLVILFFFLELAFDSVTPLYAFHDAMYQKLR